MQSRDLSVLADSLSELQGLGRPLSRLDAPPSTIPWESPLPGKLDMSLHAHATRTKKCCKAPLPVDRIASEAYPIDAAYLKDLRRVHGVFGVPSRFDGRDPIAYLR